MSRCRAWLVIVDGGLSIVESVFQERYLADLGHSGMWFTSRLECGIVFEQNALEPVSVTTSVWGHKIYVCYAGK